LLSKRKMELLNILQKPSWLFACT